MGAADHLQVPRQHGLFQHHGIDLGDGTVAHYLEGREILRSPLKEFCCNQPIEIIKHENCCAKSVTLRRAMSRIGEQRYNLLFNNCEHFANWCKTGRYRSPQVENLLHKTSLGAIVIGQLMPAASLIGLRLILEKGLIDEASRDKAKQGLEMLKKLRLKLIENLETALKKIDTWLEVEQKANGMKHKNTYPKKLLLQGQNIADELSAVEDLEESVAAMLSSFEMKSEPSLSNPQSRT